MKSYLCLLGLLLKGLGSTPVYADDLGFSIYQYGLGRDNREITASLPGQISLQGEAVACAGCHGKDLLGGGESFVSAPSLRWQSLTQPFSARKAGKVSKAYDKSHFIRAISQGISAGDRPLDPMMPRFSLASDEIEALIAYLQAADKPVEQTTAMALSLLPATGISKLADALAINIQTCSGLNPGTRLWPLQLLHYKNPADAVKQLRERLQTGQVRFIVAPFIAGWETTYLELLADYDVATLLPFTTQDMSDERQVYLALPGLQTQLKVLIDTAVHRKIKRLSVIAATDDARAEKLLAQLQDYASKQGVILEQNLSDTRPKNALRAILIISPLNRVMRKIEALQLNQDVLAMLPAPYFSPELAKQHPNWLIAYPYPPQNSADNTWQSPLSRWSQASCQILAKSAEQPNLAWWLENQQNNEKKPAASSHNLENLVQHQAVVLPWSPK